MSPAQNQYQDNYPTKKRPKSNSTAPQRKYPNQTYPCPDSKVLVSSMLTQKQKSATDNSNNRSPVVPTLAKKIVDSRRSRDSRRPLSAEIVGASQTKTTVTHLRLMKSKYHEDLQSVNHGGCDGNFPIRWDPKPRMDVTVKAWFRMSTLRNLKYRKIALR